MSELITVNDICEKHNLSRQRIYQLIEAGKIEVIEKSPIKINEKDFYAYYNKTSKGMELSFECY